MLSYDVCDLSVNNCYYEQQETETAEDRKIGICSGGNRLILY